MTLGLWHHVYEIVELSLMLVRGIQIGKLRFGSQHVTL